MAKHGYVLGQSERAARRLAIQDAHFGACQISFSTNRRAGDRPGGGTRVRPRRNGRRILRPLGGGRAGQVDQAKAS